MDENEYKLIRDELKEFPCAFEKSILALKTQCPQARKKNIAEREIVRCTSSHYATRCADWLVLLRKKSQFALKIPEFTPILPHSKEMKVQVGGMIGLCEMLGIDTAEMGFQPNVFAILENCSEQITNIEELSFEKIVREVVHFKPRAK